MVTWWWWGWRGGGWFPLVSETITTYSRSPFKQTNKKCWSDAPSHKYAVLHYKVPALSWPHICPQTSKSIRAWCISHTPSMLIARRNPPLLTGYWRRTSPTRKMQMLTVFTERAVQVFSPRWTHARARTYWLCITLFGCFVLPFNQVWFSRAAFQPIGIGAWLTDFPPGFAIGQRACHTQRIDLGGVGGSWKIQLGRSVWLCSKTLPYYIVCKKKKKKKVGLLEHRP